MHSDDEVGPARVDERGAARPPGRVVLVGAGPGSVELLTLKAARVIAAADWLVHDAMLSSWPDHLLASTRMYFRVRDKDVFAKTDAKAEMEQRAKDMRNAEKVEAMAARNEQNIRQMTPARP